VKSLEAGQLLIAPPLMPDPRFSCAVMILCHHSHTGSFALGINYEAEFTLEDISEELGLPQTLHFPLYEGGPINTGSVWMLHSAEWHITNTLPVNSEWSITSHDSMFHHILDGDTPREFRFCHGYSSWGPGQLEQELKGEYPYSAGSSWIVADDPGPDWLLNQPTEDLWETATLKARTQSVNEWL